MTSSDVDAGALGAPASTRPLRLSPSGRLAERAYIVIAGAAVLIALICIAYLLVKTFARTGDAFSTFGVWGFITGTQWIPTPVSGNPVFGALPFIYGTLVTSAIAMAIAVPIAIGVALATTVFLPRRLRGPIAGVVDLLAAVPSVIYGLWGFIVLVPALKPALQWIADNIGTHVGFLAGPVSGQSFLISGLVLAIMVLPIIAAITREVLMTVPIEQQEAAYGLGATKWEMVRGSMLPWARSGIVGASALGLGRAVGETIAIAVLLGNSPRIGGSLLGPGATLASVIANEQAEATGLHLSALTALAVVLFVMAFIINALARLLVARSAGGPGFIRKATRAAWERVPTRHTRFRPSSPAEPAASSLALDTAREGLPRVSRSRQVRSRLAEGSVYGALVVALVPLVLILGYILIKGLPAISWDFLTTTPNADPFSSNTGISSALVGTLILMGLAVLFATPLGLLTAFFMAEARNSRSAFLRRLASGIGFLVDVLLGVPSIVVGVTVFLGVVVVMGHYSALAGGLALAFIMFPIVVRTADEILRLVPGSLREAAYGLGAPRWRVAWSVVLPAAAPGLLTGVMLALARVSGETAPLLFTALGNQAFSTSILQPIASLPQLIYTNTIQIQTPQTLQTAWGAALVLVVIVLVLNLIARFIARRTRGLETR
jgi:phosphate transport system permease protein